MAYVDGFVLPVPTKNLAAYKRMARVFGKVCREHGVLAYHECVGDDLKVKMGISFPTLLKLKKGESVIFAWVLYKSKAHRTKVMAAIMKDARLKTPPKSMPFDCNRMSWGGFKSIVSI